MASINGTNGTSSLSSTLRGYGGLSSGLDRDSLIEQMTAGTRSKIAQQKQKQQKLAWTQTALRNITSKIYDFSSSYTSYASSTNLLSSKLFSRNQISALGANSKFLSVTGTSAAAQNMSILGVKQLAKNASLNTIKNASTQSMTTGNITTGSGGKLDAMSDVSAIAGDRLYVEYGGKTFSVTMATTDGYDYSTPEKAVESLNKALGEVSVGGDKTLADAMKAELVDGKMTFAAQPGDTTGNDLKIAGGTGNILQDLGFLDEGEKVGDLPEDALNIKNEAGLIVSKNDAKLSEPKTLAERLGGKEISFSYNGTVKKITTGEYTSDMTVADVQKDMQAKVDAAFGKGRVKVGLTNTDASGNLTGTSTNFTFETTKPGGGADTSSTFSVLSGDGVVGYDGIFGVSSGAGNRLNLSAKISESGLSGLGEMQVGADGKYHLGINGKDIAVDADATMDDLIKAVNNSDAGVTLSYQSMSDRFVLNATGEGASGQIEFDTTAGNIAKALFGNTDASGNTSYNITKGQDAIISVAYPGSDDVVEITRGSNNFDLDGLNVTVNGEFGYKTKTDADGNPVKDADGNPIKEIVKGEEVTFDAKVDTEKATSAVKGMIDSFNEILELVNSEMRTKPDRNYAPLTDEQREGMSESQITAWEEKAQAGLLFGDSDMRSMADALRTVVNSMDRNTLEDMGITVSTSYADNGKLVFDEEAFKAKLQEDPDAVINAFSRASSELEDGTRDQGGLMTQIKSVMDRYGSTTGATKGTFIERAGSVHAPTSVLKNSLQKQMDELDKYIDTLNDKLSIEQDRYISQFTTLESLISQMNSQSSYLSSMFSS